MKEVINAPFLNTEGLSRDMGRVMVIAPHPDDESLGCGGLIAHLREQNAEVWVLFMTNGEASHPNSQAYPAHKLGDLRKKEAIDACSILGVGEENLYFLNAGDGQLSGYDEDDNCVIRQLEVLLRKHKIDTVFAPWRRDHHIDHLVTTSMVKKAARDLEIVIAEYPIWLWKKGDRKDEPSHNEVLPFRLAVGNKKQQKLRAIQAHQSQTTRLINDDPEGFVLTEDLLEPFLTDYEYFFFPTGNKPAVNSDYFDELYKHSSDPWNFRTSVYEQNKYKKTLASLPRDNFEKVLEIGCANGVFTAMLAPKCKYLMAVDLNERALESARKRCAQYAHCELIQYDIAEGIPGEKYDMIILSEVGYYFNEEKLKMVYKNIVESLLPGGIMVMVHWTAYVRQYPLTGLQVHEIFAENYQNSFKKSSHYRHELYELMVWEKAAK